MGWKTTDSQHRSPEEGTVKRGGCSFERQRTIHIALLRLMHTVYNVHGPSFYAPGQPPSLCESIENVS